MILGLVAASITVQTFGRDNDGELVRQPDGSLLAVDATLAGAWVTLLAAVLGTGGADRRVTATFNVWTSRDAAESVGTYVVDALADPARNTEQQAWEALIASVGEVEIVSSGLPTWWTGLGYSRARLWALLSPTQRATPLDEIVWATLRGVDEIPEIRQGLWRRRLIVAASDVGTSPLGEAALAPGAVAAVVVEYRYRLVGLGIVEEQARVRYPLADGSGDAYVTAPQTTTLKGAETIGAGRKMRIEATTRAGYLLAAGAVTAQDPTHDPGPQVTHLLGGLSTLAGYDLVAAFERSGDPTVLAGLADYTGGHDAWLDLDLGGVTARALALAELAEPTTDGDGWTAWPS